MQQASNDSVLGFYKSMLAFRHNHPALSKGTIELLDMPEGVLGFIRRADGEALFCVFNMREASVVVPLPDGMTPRDIDAPPNTMAPAGGSLSLAPFGVYIGAL